MRVPRLSLRSRPLALGLLMASLVCGALAVLVLRPDTAVARGTLAAQPGVNGFVRGPIRGTLLEPMFSEFMAGGYDLQDVTIALDPDATDAPGEGLDGQARKALLGNLRGFTVPSRQQQQLRVRLGNRWQSRQDRMLQNGLMLFDSRVQGTDPMRCVPSEAKGLMLEPANHVFEASQRPGSLMIRLAAWSDLRWQRRGGSGTTTGLPGSLPCFNGCFDWSFFGGNEGCEWVARQPLTGAQVAPLPGTIPVVRWQVGPGDVAYTRYWADEQYLKASFGSQAQGTPTIQTVDIAAVPTLTGEAVADGIECPPSLDRRKRPLCSARSISMYLDGYVLRRTYNDLRVGLQPDSAGGLRVVGRFQTARRGVAGSGIYLTANGPPSAYIAARNRARATCGRAEGACGSLGPVPTIVGVDSAGQPARVPLWGVDYARGGDDSLRAVQLCSTVMRQQGGLPDSVSARLRSGGAAQGENATATACVNERNPMAEQLSDRYQVPQLVDTITPGARTRDTTTRAGRVQTNTGIRVVQQPGDTSRVNSEWRRQCQATWRRDSVRSVTTVAPGFVLDLKPAKVRYETCLLKGGEDLPAGWSALTPAGQAAQARRRP